MLTIYSKTGRQIPVRNGQQVPAGSMVLSAGKWETVEVDSIITIHGEWNNQCQSREVTAEIKPIKPSNS